METDGFSVEITLDAAGVRSVRVLGQDWDQSAEAHALLQRLSPLIQRLHTEAKRDDRSIPSRDGRVIQ